jgi:hypothetical protein
MNVGAVLVVHEFLVVVVVPVINIHIILHLQTLGQNAGFLKSTCSIQAGTVPYGPGISMTHLNSSEVTSS